MNIDEYVKAGSVTETTEYKYVGMWINKKGNCELHITKKYNSVKGQVLGLKSIASKGNVGAMYVQVRLQLYQSCILPSLLYNLEGWSMLTAVEIKMLEQTQRKTCTLLDIPTTTPYIGLLCELGLWKVEYLIMYRKLLLTNRILNSNKDRLANAILIDQFTSQTKDKDNRRSFIEDVTLMVSLLNIELNNIKELSKIIVKSQHKHENDQDIKIEVKSKTKLRFIKSCNPFKRQEYFSWLTGDDSVMFLKFRLNMLNIYGNYHNEVDLIRECPICNEANDTTGHIVTCPKLFNTITKESISQKPDEVNTQQLLDVIKCNMNSRIK